MYCAHRAGEQPSLKRSNFLGSFGNSVSRQVICRRAPGSRCLWDVRRVFDHAGLGDRSPPKVALTIADRLWTAVVIEVPAAARIYDVTQVELTGRTYRVCRKHCVLIPWPSGAEQGSPEPRWSGSATWLHHRAGDEDW